MAILANALRTGQVALPATRLSLERLGLSDAVAALSDLSALQNVGFGAAQAAVLIDQLIDERSTSAGTAPVVELVVTGPDAEDRARDTAVVVNQLIEEARSSILLVGFALYQGFTLFKRLAERFDAEPRLVVTLCLNISRTGTDTSRSGDLVDAFAYGFQQSHWPGKRLPPIYFDPRGLTLDGRERAVLHAKCIVIDRSVALVTSANPTPAAYTRNIELGVVIRGGPIPGQIEDHFRSLIDSKALAPIIWPSG